MRVCVVRVFAAVGVVDLLDDEVEPVGFEMVVDVVEHLVNLGGLASLADFSGMSLELTTYGEIAVLRERATLDGSNYMEVDVDGDVVEVVLSQLVGVLNASKVASHIAEAIRKGSAASDSGGRATKLLRKRTHSHRTEEKSETREDPHVFVELASSRRSSTKQLPSTRSV